MPFVGGFNIYELPEGSVHSNKKKVGGDGEHNARKISRNQRDYDPFHDNLAELLAGIQDLLRALGEEPEAPSFDDSDLQQKKLAPKKKAYVPPYQRPLQTPSAQDPNWLRERQQLLDSIDEIKAKIRAEKEQVASMSLQNEDLWRRILSFQNKLVEREALLRYEVWAAEEDLQADVIAKEWQLVRRKLEEKEKVRLEAEKQARLLAREEEKYAECKKAGHQPRLCPPSPHPSDLSFDCLSNHGNCNASPSACRSGRHHDDMDCVSPVPRAICSIPPPSPFRYPSPSLSVVPSITPSIAPSSASSIFSCCERPNCPLRQTLHPVLSQGMLSVTCFYVRDLRVKEEQEEEEEEKSGLRRGGGGGLAEFRRGDELARGFSPSRARGRGGEERVGARFRLSLQLNSNHVTSGSSQKVQHPVRAIVPSYTASTAVPVDPAATSSSSSSSSVFGSAVHAEPPVFQFECLDTHTDRLLVLVEEEEDETGFDDYYSTRERDESEGTRRGGERGEGGGCGSQRPWRGHKKVRGQLCVPLVELASSASLLNQGQATASQLFTLAPYNPDTFEAAYSPRCIVEQERKRGGGGHHLPTGSGQHGRHRRHSPLESITLHLQLQLVPFPLSHPLYSLPSSSNLPFSLPSSFPTASHRHSSSSAPYPSFSNCAFPSEMPPFPPQQQSQQYSHQYNSRVAGTAWQSFADPPRHAPAPASFSVSRRPPQDSLADPSVSDGGERGHDQQHPLRYQSPLKRSSASAGVSSSCSSSSSAAAVGGRSPSRHQLQQLQQHQQQHLFLPSGSLTVAVHRAHLSGLPHCLVPPGARTATPPVRIAVEVEEETTVKEGVTAWINTTSCQVLSWEEQFVFQVDSTRHAVLTCRLDCSTSTGGVVGGAKGEEVMALGHVRIPVIKLARSDGLAKDGRAVCVQQFEFVPTKSGMEGGLVLTLILEP